MKRKGTSIIVILIFTLLSINLVACKADKNETDMVTTNEEECSSYLVDKIVYDGNYITLSCNEILLDGIEFEIKNKSTENISVILDISLDGVGMSLWGNAPDWEIKANETKICKMNGDIKYLEHAVMSLRGIVFIDSTGQESFDVCDFELGGNLNIEKEFTEGEEQYSNENLVVEYVGSDAQGINFKVTNLRDKSITIGFESFTINGEDENYAISVNTITPHTTNIYSVDILSYNENYFSDDLRSFEGIMQTWIDDEGIVERFPISYGIEKTSRVEKAYQMAIDIDRNKLDVNDFGAYSYNGINISEELIGEVIDQDAVYNSLAKQLEGFYALGENFYGNWGSTTVPTVFGIDKLSSWDEMRPYIDKASLIISRSYPLGEILLQFERLSVSNGDFDFANRNFDFTINDLSVAAKEMEISEEMLGYIFACLDVYGAKTIFDGNSCSCNLEYVGRKELIDKDFVYYIDYGSQESFLDGDYDFQYFALDLTGEIVPNDSTNGFSTFRGVQILHHKDAVILSYGIGEARTFDTENDILYNSLKANDDIVYQILNTCKEYIVYSNDEEQIVFYFNDKEQVIMVAYISFIVY